MYQGLWNLGVRDLEREVIRESSLSSEIPIPPIAELLLPPLGPSAMCRKEGMGIAPWGVIGQGKFMSKKQLEEKNQSGEQTRSEITEKDTKISEALEKIAEEKDVSVTSVAIAWAMQKHPYVFPISELSYFPACLFTLP